MKAFRTAAGLTQAELAEAARVTFTAVTKVENGIQGDTLRQLDEVAANLGVRFVDLCVDPDGEDLRDRVIAATRDATTEQLRGALSLLRTSPPFDEVARGAAGAVPLLDLDVAAGPVDFRNVGTRSRWVRPHTRRKLTEHHCVVRVKGDSMAPEIESGNYLLCTTRVRSDPSGVVVIARSGGIVDADMLTGFTLKRFEGTPARPGGDGPWSKVRLVPVNSSFRTIVLKAKDLVDFEIVAEVVEVLGRTRA